MSTTTTHDVQKQKKVLTESNVLSAAISSKTWNVINNTDTDLVAIDAFLTDPSSTDELYQRTLQLMSASDGKQVIKSGATQTMTFGEAHTNGEGYAVDYTVIIARADNLFPVKIVELPVSGEGSSFLDATIAAGDAKLMKQAEAFQQTIIAFPTSEMATAFSTVLTNPDEQKIADFFKAYPKYGAITLDMVTALQTYYNRYGFVWAGYTGNQSYFLYTSDGTKKKSMGSISISNQTVAPLSSLDAPAGFKAAYTDANHRNTVLHYSDGQFSDDVTSSSPKICLQGLFILKSQLTGQETDNTLTPLLYGVVNDTEVFGYTDSSLLLSAASGKSVINTLLDPQDVWGWLKLSGLVVGALAAVAVLAVTARFIIKAIKSGLNPSPEDIRRRNREKAQKIVNKMDPELKRKLKIPDDLSTATSDIKKQVSENLLKNSKRKMGDIMSKQLDTCKKLLDYGNTKTLQDVVANTEHNLEVLSESDPGFFLEDRMSGFITDVSNNAKLLSERVKTLGKEISKTDADTISEAKRISDDFTNRVMENEKIRETFEENEIPEFIEE